MARKKKFKSKLPFKVPQKDAQKVGERLLHLTVKYGGELKPDLVVEDAKSPRSILHKYFEWDNESAAEKYRLDQARQLIRCVVEVVIIQGKQVEHRSFLNIKNYEGKHVYVTLDTVVQEPDYMNQLISEAIGYIGYLNNTLEMLQQYLRKKRKIN